MLRMNVLTSKHHFCQVLSCSARHVSNKQTGNSSQESQFCIQPVGEKDMVGPPDPISNIRPILVHIPDNETELEKKYRLQRDEVQKWNQEFWIDHNTRFLKGREQFVKKTKESKNKEEGESLTADEMSVFYKQFLDGNWKTHVTYNKQWYKKNIGLMLLSFQVLVTKNLQLISNKITNKKS